MKRYELPLKIGPVLTTYLIIAATFLMLFVMISSAIAPVQYDLSAGAVAPITITATKDVEDTLATEALIRIAEESVEPIYVSDSSVINEIMAQVKDSFRHLSVVNGLTMPDALEGPIARDNLLNQAATTLSPLSIEPEMIKTIIEADPDLLNQLADSATYMIEDIMGEPFWSGQEGTVIDQITADLKAQGYPDDLIDIVTVIAREYLRPNMVLDEAAMELNKQKAREDVEPVIFKRGQNIVRAGEVITVSQINMLNSLGMLKDRGMDWSMYLGITILLVLMLGMVAIYLYSFERELLGDPIRMALLSCILLLVIALSLLVRNLNTFLMPVALGAMLTTLLLKPRLALTTGVVLSIMTGMLSSTSGALMSTNMYSVVLTSIFSSSLCVTVIKRRQQRSNILLAGVIVAIANALATIGTGLTNSANLRNVLENALWAAGSGILSAVLCIGLQPVLEWIFNIDTSAKLLELSNPNHPLLRRLLMEAPGTYHHSIVVANLAEAGASAIGANGLLARVGAYYHDIGKLKRPMYFKENQLSDNPHDRTDPRVSTAILTAHPPDGVQMAQKHRLPLSIQEIIQEHHGDAPALYFYDKANKQGIDANIDDFRYAGPKPRSRESAIVMLADTIEASARSMRDSTPESIHQLIQRMIRGKMEDGQLDDCPLTFADLKVIGDAFMTVLTGVFHERIEYPNVDIPERITIPAAQELDAREVHAPVEKVPSPQDEQSAMIDAGIPQESPREPEQASPASAETMPEHEA